MTVFYMDCLTALGRYALSLGGGEQHEHSAKHLFLRSTEEIKHHTHLK